MILDYDTLIPALCPPYRDALVEFSRRAGSTSSFFELGVGTGNIAKAILDANPTASYSGVDIDEPSLEIARRKLSGYSCRLHCADFRAVDLPSVDTLVSALSIHHLTHPEQESLLRMIAERGKRFLHFELVAPEDDAEKRRFDEFEQHLIREVAPSHGLSPDAAGRLYAQSKQNDKPMRLSEHVGIHKKLGVQLDVVFKDGCFVFYETSSAQK